MTASHTHPSSVCPERWVDEHGDCLYRYALMRLRKPEIAEDLVQETFLAALRAQNNFGALSSERNWLLGILKNKICDRFRKLGRETNFTDLEFLSDDHARPFDGEHVWLHGCGPREWKPEGEVAMNRKEFWQAFYDCIERLPERLAQVFTMREMEGLTGKEICATLNISEANLWVMLHRARMALREDLEKTFFNGNADRNL